MVGVLFESIASFLLGGFLLFLLPWKKSFKPCVHRKPSPGSVSTAFCSNWPSSEPTLSPVSPDSKLSYGVYLWVCHNLSVLLLFIWFWFFFFMLRQNPWLRAPYDLLCYHDVLLIPKSVVLDVLEILETILICFSILPWKNPSNALETACNPFHERRPVLSLVYRGSSSLNK